MTTRAHRLRLSAYALIRDANRVLLCRLSNQLSRWEGFWTLPGGGVEFGETPEHAMIREVEEETGLRVAPRSVAGIDTIVDVSGVDDFHGVRIIYHVDVTGGSLRNEADGTTDCCQWHALDAVSSLKRVDLAEAGLRLLSMEVGAATKSVQLAVARLTPQA